MLIISTLIIIIALSVDISHCSSGMRLTIAKERRDNLRYKLSENVFPENYTLRIFPHFNNYTFMGCVKILIHIKKPTSYITLHQKGLNITKEKIFITTTYNLIIRIKNAGISGTNEQEFYTITFPQTLTENTYYLYIPEFYGELLSARKKGFYYARYTDENGELCTFATTQFEATSARQAFPCFDEPSFRAKFKIYIVRPFNYHSISNTKLINSIQLNDNNTLYEDEFETTLSMPTYLLSFVVSQMKRTSHEMNNFHGIVARPEVINKMYEKYALKLSIKVLKTLETYLNVNYSLNKIDQVAIPDAYYLTGGMENWGLVTYKEKTLLFTPRTTTELNMLIDEMIIHEYTHQWFGNLVTIKWWRYIWLKEGFARFFENKILNIIKPEWRKMEQFIINEKQSVLEIDSFNTTRDMNQDAGSPSEIQALYDIIAYRKGACVIHMLETVMTSKIFRYGLTNYLQGRAFKAAVPTDLYRNLQNALDGSTIKLPNYLTIAKIMTTWDSQKGYPLVYVQRHYDKYVNVVKLSQSRYVNIKTSKPTRWHIPINYATESNPNFKDTKFTNWLSKSNKEITINDLNPGDWLILNKQEAFYYRVNYDLKNWKLITKALLKNHSDIHVLNRAQIIDDSFSLSYLAKLKISIPLKLSEYLYKDDDYITHLVFIRNIINILKFFRGAEGELNFQKYVIRILKRSYKRLGVEPKANDTHIDKLHRKIVVEWMCNFNYFKCRNKALKIFKLWREHNVSLPLDLEEEIMCNAIRMGNEFDWNYLFNRYHTDNCRDFKINAFNALGCTEDALLIYRFLDSSLNSSSPYNIIQVVTSVSSRGLVGAEILMDYFSKYVNVLQSKLGDSYILRYFTAITSSLTTQAQLKNFTHLLERHGKLENIFEQNLEKIEKALSLKEKFAKQVSNYFNQMRSSGNLWNTISNTFAFIISYSLIFTLFVY